MPTTVQTAAVYTNTVAAQKVPVLMDEKISFKEESAFRFESITRRLRKVRSVNNMKSEFMEMDLYPVVMIGSAVESGVTISVNYPEYAHRDQMIYNTRTHETYLMNEDIGGTGSAGKITVVNQSGSGSISTATAVGDVYLILPEAHAEGEALPPAFTNKPDFLSTYLMQSDKTLKYTDLAKDQGEYGMQQYLIDRKQAWISWKQQMNLKLLLGGQVRETTSGDGRRHMSRGLRDWIATNKQSMADVGGSLNLTVIGTMLRETMTIGASSDFKIGIAGQNATISLSALPASAIRTTVNDTSWGKKIKTLVTPFGNLNIEYDKCLSDEFGLADNFIVLDPKSPHRLVYANKHPKMVMNVTDASDYHNQQDLITGTWGLEVRLEELNAWVYGIA